MRSPTQLTAIARGHTHTGACRPIPNLYHTYTELVPTLMEKYGTAFECRARKVSVDVRWRNCGRRMEIVVVGCAAWYSRLQGTRSVLSNHAFDPLSAPNQPQTTVSYCSTTDRCGTAHTIQHLNRFASRGGFRDIRSDYTQPR